MMHEKHHHSLLLLSVSVQNLYNTIAWLSVTLYIHFFSCLTHTGHSFSRTIYFSNLLFNYIFKSLYPSTVLDISNFRLGPPHLGFSKFIPHRYGNSLQVILRKLNLGQVLKKIVKFLQFILFLVCETLYYDLYKGFYIIACVVVIR